MKSTMNDDLVLVINTIPMGIENSISRGELRSQLGFTDRYLRRLIHEARKDGCFIISIGKGYFKADNDEELIQFYNTQMNRIKNIFAILRPIRLYLKAKGVRV